MVNTGRAGDPIPFYQVGVVVEGTWQVICGCLDGQRSLDEADWHCHACLSPASSGDGRVDLLAVDWSLLVEGKGDPFFRCYIS